MQKIADFNFKGYKTLVRVDFNVKLDEHYHIIDDTRIKAALPTINKILRDGGRAILISHMGRPKGQYEEKYSFKHIKDHLAKLLQRNVHFFGNCIGDEAERIAENDLNDGEALLLENLRFHSGEKDGNEDFAQELANLAEVYVNDAFGTAHRAHASTYTVARYFPEGKKMTGLLMGKEIEHGHHLVNTPEHPYTALLGGSKVSDKIQLIRSLIQKADNILIGGGMAFTFLHSQGYDVGQSIVEGDKLNLADSILKEAKQNNVNIYLPTDCVVTDAITNESEKVIRDIHSIPDDLFGADIGPVTIEVFSDIIKNSRTIFWNGPLGIFEFDGLDKGTYHTAMAVSEATQEGAYSLIGGGDTATAFDTFNLINQASFISTGGGALLTFIAGEELPALKVLHQKLSTSA